jgi:hypothetical protein
MVRIRITTKTITTAAPMQPMAMVLPVPIVAEVGRSVPVDGTVALESPVLSGSTLGMTGASALDTEPLSSPEDGPGSGETGESDDASGVGDGLSKEDDEELSPDELEPESLELSFDIVHSFREAAFIAKHG